MVPDCTVICDFARKCINHTWNPSCIYYLNQKTLFTESMAPYCPLDLMCFASLYVEMWFPWGGGAVGSLTVLLLQQWSRSNFLKQIANGFMRGFGKHCSFFIRVSHAENRHVSFHWKGICLLVKWKSTFFVGSWLWGAPPAYHILHWR